jgi:hypothetical protein
VLLSATATDPDDGVARVEFLLNDAVVGTATQPSYEVTIPAQPGAMGYWYVARAVDRSGLATRSETRLIYFYPPVARITQPSANSLIRGVDSFVIVAEAFDPEGRLARLDLCVDTAVVASFSQAPFTVVLPITQKWWEGRRIRALATDADGLQTWSASVWAEVYPSPPTNDSFAHATPLAGFFTEARGRLGGATHEPGEPVIAPAAQNGSVWYRWTAPADGQVIIMTDLDSLSAGLYQGDTVAGLTPLAVSSIGTARQLVAPVVGGATYYLSLEGAAQWPNEFGVDLLLLPDAQGTLAAGLSADGSVAIQGFDFPNGLHVLEVSSDLRSWTPIQTNAAPGVNFSELIDRAVLQRFYRVVTHYGSAANIKR